MSYSSVLLVGCGNMAGAMLNGWLAGGIAPQTFRIFDPGKSEAPEGVQLLPEMPTTGAFDAVLFGVKPQMLADVAPSVAPALGENTALLSILAGIELDVLRQHFPRAGAVVRVMPNLAAALGKSPIGLVDQGLDAAGRARVTEFFEPLGTPEWVAEAQFDLFTALAGCGPGFVYRFIDALASGAASLGLDPELAERLAVSMVEGASMLAAGSPDSPGELANKVASPGGSTREGMNVLDADEALAKLMERTLRASRDRNAEMAAQARK